MPLALLAYLYRWLVARITGTRSQRRQSLEAFHHFMQLEENP